MRVYEQATRRRAAGCVLRWLQGHFQLEKEVACGSKRGTINAVTGKVFVLSTCRLRQAQLETPWTKKSQFEDILERRRAGSTHPRHPHEERRKQSESNSLFRSLPFELVRLDEHKRLEDLVRVLGREGGPRGIRAREGDKAKHALLLVWDADVLNLAEATVRRKTMASAKDGKCDCPDSKLEVGVERAPRQLDVEAWDCGDAQIALPQSKGMYGLGILSISRKECQSKLSHLEPERLQRDWKDMWTPSTLRNYCLNVQKSKKRT